jgi:hypothetical protein
MYVQYSLIIYSMRSTYLAVFRLKSESLPTEAARLQAPAILRQAYWCLFNVCSCTFTVYELMATKSITFTINCILQFIQCSHITPLVCELQLEHTPGHGELVQSTQSTCAPKLCSCWDLRCSTMESDALGDGTLSNILLPCDFVLVMSNDPRLSLFLDNRS